MIKIDWTSCHSGQMPSEQRIIETWVKEIQDTKNRDLRILEIGSDEGQSTALLAQFGVVFAIDLWGDGFDGSAGYDIIGSRFMTFQQNMNRLKLVDRVFPICSTSTVLDHLQYMALDVVYIDACHYYNEVKKDIDGAFRHLAYGGVMIFDDFECEGYGYPYKDGRPPDHGDSWPGVSQAVREFLKNHQDYDILDHINAKAMIGTKQER